MSVSYGFQYAIAFVLPEEDPTGEGEIVDLHDGGGLTRWGLTQSTYPALNLSTLTIEEAIALYRKDFWEAIHLDLLPWPIAVCAFDGAVNHGQQTAVKLLQSAVGVPEDGVIGPVTAQAARRDGSLEQFAATRLARYLSRPNYPRFGTVWRGRLFRCYRYCLGVPR